jgi:pyruvate formate-lyase activating enzyme-like uncharacterized protein
LWKIKKMAENSAYIGELPSGCEYCGPGQKMVLLITGKCSCRCFYCPLSFKKRGKDVIYANELKVSDVNEILVEARSISAKGAGITGGDPMVRPELTLQAITLLKNTFGDKHHIHLYTAGKFNIKYISKLASAGLDEIRFHPPISTWNKLNHDHVNLLKEILKTDMLVGSEIPVIPGYEDVIINYAKRLDEIGLRFLNLNELEFSESNWESLTSRGYRQKDELANTVLGSEELAYKILKELADAPDFNLNVHYCSARFKDRQQLTNRIKRRANNTIQPHHVLTDDGTFLIGIIEPTYKGSMGDLVDVKNRMKKQYEIPDNLIVLNQKLNRLEIAPWVLAELIDELTLDIRSRSFIIEEYPTADRLEVERIPLDEFKYTI